MGDGKLGRAEELAGLVHAVLDQEILGAFLGDFFEKLAEIAAV